MTADEIFITSTTKALCWARTWEGEPVGDGQHYPIYDKLMAAWQAHVGCDFVAQAHNYHERLDDWCATHAMWLFISQYSNSHNETEELNKWLHLHRCFYRSGGSHCFPSLPRFLLPAPFSG